MDEETYLGISLKFLTSSSPGSLSTSCSSLSSLSMTAFNLPSRPLRGLRGSFRSVCEIMTKSDGSAMSANLIDLYNGIGEQQNPKMRAALRKVPLKFLKFGEDVRPPYIGTISGLPTGVTSLAKIGRNPISRKGSCRLTTTVIPRLNGKERRRRGP